MKIKSLHIEKLFEMFDYDIAFSKNENVLIITGPNGYGKTMVLNIIFNLFNRKFLFFQQLVFVKIILFLENNIVIEILKNSKNDVQFIFKEIDNKAKTKKSQEKIIESFVYSNKIDEEILSSLQMYIPLSRMDSGTWMDYRTDRIISVDEVINEYSHHLPESLRNKITKIKSKKTIDILNSIKVHLIKEQRLFKKVNSNDRNHRSEKDQTIMIETIQTYATELKSQIIKASHESFIKSQELDSTYPNRLISETNVVTEAEYNSRFTKLKEKQEKLTKNSLYESKHEPLGYSQSDSKALLVYLNDLEQKLKVFDVLLKKLEIFTNILNERRFTHKTINIDKDKGFYFKTTNNKPLELNQLSSGEQHEVVLLYELIFNTNPDILVLIDEPEISLHITWQKEFLNDLLKIIDIQNIQVLIATHSPSIINGRWDLVYNLQKIENE